MTSCSLFLAVSAGLGVAVGFSVLTDASVGIAASESVAAGGMAAGRDSSCACDDPLKNENESLIDSIFFKKKTPRLSLCSSNKLTGSVDHECVMSRQGDVSAGVIGHLASLMSRPELHARRRIQVFTFEGTPRD